MSSAAAVRKTVSVLFCDLAGSTALGEHLDPESFRAVMAAWHDAMRRPIERHGGSVEKFIGDAVMAVFGVPQVHEDDALRAVRAAVEMREALAALNAGLAAHGRPALQIRIGVNTGEVVAGGGDDGTLVTGDAVNTAKRLEQAAGPDEILIGEPTRRLVDNAALLEPSPAIDAKGKSEPVEAWRVLGTIEGAASFARRLDAPFVGRADELSTLRWELAAASRERSCRLVTVLGAAGLGKSRLASEFAEEVSPGATVLGVRCLPYGDGITFWPLLELIRSAGGDDALAEAVRDEPDRELILERMSVLTGSAAPSSPEETFWAVRRVLEALARERPVVLELEDIHWAEPTFLDLVEYVVGWCRDAPIVLLCLARPELLDERPDWLGVRGRSLTLEPLNDEESDELLETLDTPLEADARARIREAAEGNPLFVEQMVAMLTEHPGETAMPPTIQALLAARLDRLAPADRSVLERASVLGKEFARGGVAELSPPEDMPNVGTVLLALMRRDLIEPGRTPVPGDDGFRFRHALIRDAAYSGIPKEVRADLHERAAALFERQGVTGELVGYHLEQAYRYREELGVLDASTRALGTRAGWLLGAAGRRAFSLEDMPAAVNLVERALALIDASDPERLELQRELSMALWWTGDVSRAESLLDDLIAAAVAAGDSRQQWYGLVERAARRTIFGGDAEADELLLVAADAVPVFESLDDAAGLARAWRRIAYAHQLRLRYAAAEDAAILALGYAQKAGEAQEEARIVDVLCTSLLYGPTPAHEAVARCEEMLEHERESRVVEANISISLAGLLAMLGRLDEARTYAERAKSVYSELGQTMAVAGWTQIAGPMELLAADPAAAERHLRLGLDLLAEAGSQEYQASLLAEALYQLGSYDEADSFAELALAQSGAGDDAARVIASGVRAKVQASLRPEQVEEALATARGAAELAAATDALNLWADSLVSVAHVLHRAGRDDESRAVLQDAADVYGRKGNVVAAEQAVGGAAQRAP